MTEVGRGAVVSARQTAKETEDGGRTKVRPLHYFEEIGGGDYRSLAGEDFVEEAGVCFWVEIGAPVFCYD